jgi:manganese oxidase
VVCVRALLRDTLVLQVGDELEVTFMNMATVPYTMHPHGVKYDQANEGVYFKFSKGSGSKVEPMGTYVYKVQG